MNAMHALPRPEATFNVVSKIMRDVESADSTERRISIRKQFLEAAIAQPLDEEFQPVGDSMEVLCRDVSVSGVGFFSVVPIDIQYMRLTFTEGSGSSENVVYVEVMHQTKRGPMYIVGSKLIANWNSQ